MISSDANIAARKALTTANGSGSTMSSTVLVSVSVAFSCSNCSPVSSPSVASKSSTIIYEQHETHLLSRYFNSKFHIFDATVIVAGFIVDVLLHGTIEEAGSLIVVGRLWRVFKIIEEFSSGADDQIEELQERIELLEKENRVLQDSVRTGGNGGQSYGTTD
jgi:hypothetical protein